MQNNHMYIAIDLKTFYASVECVERNLDPLDTNLVVADPQKKSITLKITKKYGKERISFNKVISEPAGLSASEKREIEIKEFVVEEGKTLDLSQYWDRIVDNRLEAPVLPEANKHDFRYVTIN